MIHSVRWTTKKISQRIELIEPLVYRRRQLLTPFRYHSTQQLGPQNQDLPPFIVLILSGSLPFTSPRRQRGKLRFVPRLRVGLVKSMNKPG